MYGKDELIQMPRHQNVEIEWYIEETRQMRKRLDKNRRVKINRDITYVGG